MFCRYLIESIRWAWLPLLHLIPSKSTNKSYQFIARLSDEDTNTEEKYPFYQQTFVILRELNPRLVLDNVLLSVQNNLWRRKFGLYFCKSDSADS